MPPKKFASNHRRTLDIWTDPIWSAWLDMQDHAELNIERRVEMWLVGFEIA